VNRTFASSSLIPVTINLGAGSYISVVSPGSLKKNAGLINFQDQSASTLKQSKKERTHRFSIIPFFSIDHISARLQEQYEYGDQDESDYTKREKPDMSYTLGLLAEYQLSNSLSLQSGFSLSNTSTS